MLAPYLSIAFLGWLACFVCYYAIQRRQTLPVLASAASTLSILAVSSLLPDAWHLHDTTWQAFWLGSSFCGMNNNRYVNMRNIHLVWLVYAVFFAAAYHYLPLPGGYLGTLALLASCTWIFMWEASAYVWRHTIYRH